MSYTISGQTVDRGQLFFLNQNLFAAAIPPVAFVGQHFLDQPIFRRNLNPDEDN